MIDSLKSAVLTAQALIKEKVNKGDTVIDATCGNGGDSLFLSELIGDEGFLLSVDLQEEAVTKTEEVLKENGLSNFKVVRGNHNALDKLLPEELHGNLKAVMFNLGYLPGSDKTVKTNSTDTLESVKKALDLLGEEGIITICLYSHPEGQEEIQELLDFVNTLTGKFNAYEIKRLNRKDPPFVIVITKEK